MYTDTACSAADATKAASVQQQAADRTCQYNINASNSIAGFANVFDLHRQVFVSCASQLS